MKILILNGSPAGDDSITLQTVLYLQKLFPDHEYRIENAARKIKAIEKDFAPSREALLSKVLVGSFYTRFPGPLSLLMGADPQLANFEGMCLGPMVDGHPTVLLVNDSEKGKGNSYARLQDYVRVMLF